MQFVFCIIIHYTADAHSDISSAIVHQLLVCGGLVVWETANFGLNCQALNARVFPTFTEIEVFKYSSDWYIVRLQMC